MSFLTEQTIEAYLVNETRDLPMPNGSTRPHTTFKLVWSSVDILNQTVGVTTEQLVQGALEESTLQGIGFEEAFDGVVAWLHGECRKSLNRYH